MSPVSIAAHYTVYVYLSVSVLFYFSAFHYKIVTALDLKVVNFPLLTTL